MSINIQQSPVTGVPAPQVPLITGSFTTEDYIEQILTLPVGAVFKFQECTILYESVLGQLGRIAYEQAQDFYVQYLQPGTLLYSIYGENTFLVVSGPPNS